MADPERDAARELLDVTGNRGRITIETATPWARQVVAAYLDSLLGELPPEAEQAAHDSLDVVDGRNWAGATRSEMVDAILTAFLRSLRDSLVSGRGEQNEV